jgi:acyl carrier protein
MTHTVEAVIGVISDHHCIPKVAVTDHLGLDLGLDSLDIMELAMYIEEAFDIQLSSAQISSFNTVQSVIDMVNTLLE